MTLEREGLSRRGFLDRSLAALTMAGLPLWYAREVLADDQEKNAAASKLKKSGPNDQIVMAAIGVGGQGTGIMKRAKKKPGVKYVAVCDLDATTEKRRPRRSAATVMSTKISANSWPRKISMQLRSARSTTGTP